MSRQQFYLSLLVLPLPLQNHSSACIDSFTPGGLSLVLAASAMLADALSLAGELVALSSPAQAVRKEMTN